MTDPRAGGTAPRPSRLPSQPSQSAGAGPNSSTNDAVPSLSGSGNSPDISDEESADMSARDHGSPSDSVRSSAHGRIKSESEGPSGSRDAAGDTLRMPLQKRRRVTRACDECRRKKIKCDGKQPCTHCSVYSYGNKRDPPLLSPLVLSPYVFAADPETALPSECTYDKPSNRRRNPAPQYIEALEARLQRAETLLRKFMPDVDLTDPSLDPAVQQEFQKREQARAQAMKLEREAAKGAENQDAHIMSMIESIGQLDLNEGGEWDFHGISSGAVFLGRMKDHFQGMLGTDQHTPFYQRPKPVGMFCFNAPKLGAGGPWEASAVPNIYDLPPQDKVRTLCYYAINCATCLVRIVHVPTFYERLQKLYDTPHGSWGAEEHRFLGLLYAAMALGCMYNTEDGPSKTPTAHKLATEEG